MECRRKLQVSRENSSVHNSGQWCSRTQSETDRPTGLQYHLTKNEEQKQFLLQVVKEHRKLYPDSKKSMVIAGLHLAADNPKDDPSPPEDVDSN